MSEIQYRTDDSGTRVLLGSLSLGRAASLDEACAEAEECLANYVASCEEALDLLNGAEHAGQLRDLGSDLNWLFGFSALRLWSDGKAVEVRAGRGRLSRATGRRTAATVRQALEAALRRAQTAQQECCAQIPA